VDSVAVVVAAAAAGDSDISITPPVNRDGPAVAAMFRFTGSRLTLRPKQMSRI